LEITERPLTSCPECAGEIDLTFSDVGDTVTCTVCGAVLLVTSLDPPDVEPYVEPA
jgi:lysine biosynthesis protein LysW